MLIIVTILAAIALAQDELVPVPFSNKNIQVYMASEPSTVSQLSTIPVLINGKPTCAYMGYYQTKSYRGSFGTRGKLSSNRQMSKFVHLLLTLRFFLFILGNVTEEAIMWFRSGIGDFLVLSPFVIGLLGLIFFGSDSVFISIINSILSVLILWGILKAIDAVKASFKKDEKLEEKKEPN